MTGCQSRQNLTTEVQVKNGIITLRGEADSEAQKDRQPNTPKENVEGAKELKNEMTVLKKASGKRA
jgi:osmotically-inducible protein OsmY